MVGLQFKKHQMPDYVRIQRHASFDVWNLEARAIPKGDRHKLFIDKCGTTLMYLNYLKVVDSSWIFLKTWSDTFRSVIPLTEDAPFVRLNF